MSEVSSLLLKANYEAYIFDKFFTNLNSLIVGTGIS